MSRSQDGMLSSNASQKHVKMAMRVPRLWNRSGVAIPDDADAAVNVKKVLVGGR